MRLPPLISVTVGLIATAAFMPAEPIIQKSDVVFMYQADPATYAAYQTTLLAWGGRPTEQSLQDAHGQGTAYFGSVGMVTEFGRYYERFPDTYQEGLGRDLDGAPIKVPWLVDHQHNGIPFWVCCTRQPNFRQYLHERVAETVRGGADGVHIDDHMGTAAFVWQGLCFCDRCEADFIPYLKTHLSDPEQVAHGIHEIDTFDYSDTVSAWLAANPSRQFNQHPLWRHWTVYHANYTVVFMAELKADAAEIAGHPVPFGANAGLLWPNHLADYQVLDLFSSETDHHANERRFSDLPVLAYRLADAVGRPYAATAAGSDWAFIKAHGLTELVRGWTALAYASGQLFMPPSANGVTPTFSAPTGMMVPRKPMLRSTVSSAKTPNSSTTTRMRLSPSFFFPTAPTPKTTILGSRWPLSSPPPTSLTASCWRVTRSSDIRSTRHCYAPVSPSWPRTLMACYPQTVPGSMTSPPTCPFSKPSLPSRPT